jgi:hypothetical protein
MRKPSFVLALVIPSPVSRSDQIEIFFQTSINELNNLWVSALETYDASLECTFELLYNIDNLNTNKKFASLSRAFDTYSKLLDHGKKI